jgi:hypothetical protein
MSFKIVMLSGFLALGSATLPMAAHAERFDIDFEAARAAGSGCRLGENAFLEESGPNAVLLELNNFGVSLSGLVVPAVGSPSSASTARSTCVLALPGLLPRGFTVRSVRTQGAYDVRKSSTADVRLAARVVGAGLDASAAQLAFPSGRAAFNQGASFSLTNVVEDDGGLCNTSRSENVTLSVVYAASAVKGSAHSYADLELSPGRGLRVSFDVRPCR